MTANAPRSFRSVAVASVATTVGLIILISLGVWQLKRLAWKEALIATLHERLAAAPVPLPPPSRWSGLTAEDSEFRRVRLHVDFPELPRAALYAGAPALRADIKGPGYFIFAPARLPGGAIVVINVGWVSAEKKYEWSGAGRDIIGYLRWPEQPGLFMPAHNESDDIWFVRDPQAMAGQLGWGKVAPFYIDMEAPVPASGQPRPGPLKVNLRNNHLGYALTWFGLAGTLACIFAFWLYFGRRKTVNAEARPSL